MFSLQSTRLLFGKGTFLLTTLGCKEKENGQIPNNKISKGKHVV